MAQVKELVDKDVNQLTKIVFYIQECRRKHKNIKKRQIEKTQIRLLEIRNTMYEMKNTLDVIRSRLDIAKERVVNLKT